MKSSHNREFSVVRRAALLIPSNPGGNLSVKHLFVVMCDPVGPQKEVLLVSISSYIKGRKGHDDTCLLEPGDHPFIKHTSYVQYRSARQEPAIKLEQGVEKKLYTAQAKMNERVFQRVLDGFSISAFVKPFTRDFLPKPSPFQ